MTSTTDRYMRGRTAIRATRLFDGTGTATRADPLIVVSDGRISSIDDVGPGAAVPPTPSWWSCRGNAAARAGRYPRAPGLPRRSCCTQPRHLAQNGRERECLLWPRSAHGQLRPVVAVHGKHDGRHPPSPGILLRAEGSLPKAPHELREGEQEGTIATDVADGRTTGLINRLRPEPAPYDDLPRNAARPRG
jgi:hypothetical protein